MLGGTVLHLLHVLGGDIGEKAGRVHGNRIKLGWGKDQVSVGVLETKLFELQCSPEKAGYLVVQQGLGLLDIVKG